MMKEKFREVQQRLLDYLLYLDQQPAGMVFVDNKPVEGGAVLAKKNIQQPQAAMSHTSMLEERDTCKKLLLFHEIEIISLKIICALGATAIQALLGDDMTTSKTRGMFFQFNNISVIPTYHPAYVLRDPAAHKTVLEDMQKIVEKLQTNS